MIKSWLLNVMVGMDCCGGIPNRSSPVCDVLHFEFVLGGLSVPAVSPCPRTQTRWLLWPPLSIISHQVWYVQWPGAGGSHLGHPPSVFIRMGLALLAHGYRSFSVLRAVVAAIVAAVLLPFSPLAFHESPGRRRSYPRAPRLQRDGCSGGLHAVQW